MHFLRFAKIVHMCHVFSAATIKGQRKCDLDLFIAAHVFVFKMAKKDL